MWLMGWLWDVCVQTWTEAEVVDCMGQAAALVVACIGPFAAFESAMGNAAAAVACGEWLMERMIEGGERLWQDRWQRY